MTAVPALHDCALSALLTHWEDKARETADHAKVEFSGRSQWYRFEAFSRRHDLRGASLLDVGCGIGDFLAYLRDEAFDVDFTGTDLSPSMIDHCRARFPGVAFEAGNLLESNTPQRYDYTTAFGIHNIRVPGAADLLEALTRRQFELCTVATHVSLLTDRFEGYADHILAWDPTEVLRMALSITPYVSLRNDYLPHDFSITLYHEPLADREPLAYAQAQRRAEEALR